MNKLSSILVCLLAPIAAFGQFEWVLDNGIAHEYVHKFIKTEKSQYVILHGKNDVCCPENLTILDSLGNTLFNFTANADVGSYYIAHFKDIIEMSDSTISFATKNSFYDTLSMQGLIYSAVLKLGADWTPTIIAEDMDVEYDFGASLSDGSFILIETEETQIRRMLNDGEQIWQMGLLGFDVLDLGVKNNDSILIATEQGLLVMDEDGNMVAQFPSLVFNQIKTNGQDGIIGVKNDSVYLLSSDYSLSAVAGYQGDQVRDFSVEDNMIAVLTFSGHVYRYDASLSQVNDFQLFNDGEFRHIAIGNERLVLSGIEVYGGLDEAEGTRTVFVKEYSLEGNDYGLSKDIGVVGLAQPQETQVVNSGSNFKVIFKNIKVIVTNFGTNPLESLYLRSQSFKSNQFNNLGLAPGDEVELTIDAIERTFSSDPAGIDLNLCFWTSHPDLLMDLDASNDSYCNSFLVNDKEALIQNLISVFPNPTAEVLNVQINGFEPLGNVSYRIVSADGRIVKRGIPAQATYTFEVPVRDWALGMYFLQLLEDGAVMGSTRFVVVK